MKMFTPLRGFLFVGACCALILSARAQIIELRANINAAQETPTVSTSPATGTAIMLYDIGTNKFDLMISISGLSNTATASHIHEGITGVAGGVVTNLGGETAYTRSGNTLTATFRDVPHGGDKLKLIQGGAYFNIHSAQFPGGEVRGQLIPRPVRLVANMNVAQEQAAFPNVNLSALNDFGAAVMFYDPMANTVSLRFSVFNFTNTLSNSHYHEGAPGVSGPVVVNLGNSVTAPGYSNANGFLAGTFDIPYVGPNANTIPDPIKLLTGGAYLNFHSSTFSGGEVRGQVRVSNELATTRFANLSVRGFVGTGEQVLIQGITVNGPDPIRAVITAKGPSLSAFGIAAPLANPRLALFDSAGRQIALNDDVGTVAAGSELANIPGIPRNTVESALVVVLPPGNYTAIVSSASGTGVALLEVADLRTLGGVVAAGSNDGSLVMRSRAAAPSKYVAALAKPAAPSGKYVAAVSVARAAIEMCVGVPLPVATAQR